MLALTRYDAAGPSSRYRFYQFMPRLRAAGFRIDEAPLFDAGYVARLYGAGRRSPLAAIEALGRRLWQLRRARRYDLLWIEKELIPFAPALPERLLRRSGARLVVDYDDATFHQYDRHAGALVRGVLGRKIDRVMAAAALVIAGNAYLAGRARAAGAAAVEILPTVVDLDRYPPPASPRAGRLTLGWIGSPATQSYLLQVAPALAAFCAEGGARMLAIGARPGFSVPGVPLEIVRWTEGEEVRALRELDVGLMPLPDSPWERGKCGLKLIQYMACGLPVVASPVGVNREIVTGGETGLLATTHEEWLSALRALGASAELRRRMGAAGRVAVEARYSLQLAAPRLAELLGRTAGRRSGAPVEEGRA